MGTLAATGLAIFPNGRELAIFIWLRVAGRESGYLGAPWSRPGDSCVECVTPGQRVLQLPPGRPDTLPRGPSLLGLLVLVGPRPLEEAGGGL